MQLVPDWRNWWRWWSVRLVALGAILEVFADAIPSLIMALPIELRATLSPEHIQWAAYACIVAGIVARVIRQPRLDRAPDDAA